MHVKTSATRSAAMLPFQVKIVLSAASLMSMSACASNQHWVTGIPSRPTVVVSYYHGVPEGDLGGLATAVRIGTDLDETGVIWGGDGQLSIITWGSASCPNLPSVVSLVDSHHISIATTSALRDRDSTGRVACTADISQTTAVVKVPEGTDVSAPVHVIVDGIDHVLPAPEPSE